MPSGSGGSPGSEDPLAQANRLRASLEQGALPNTAREIDKKVDAFLAREAEDRSWIAKRIIGIFTGVIAGVLAILALGAGKTGDWTAAGTQAVDLIKSAVLPVVTLVLGYYFGRSGKG